MDKTNIQLTNEQEKILDICVRNNIYVSASPGSGKSSVLGLIANKITKEILDKNIILVTFTNKAARLIISKCENIDKTRIVGGTFHGLAMQFLRNNNINLNICDEGKKRLIIKKVFNCKKDKEKFEELLDEISLAKCEWPKRITEKVKKYNDELLKYKLYDFDDIIYTFIDLIPNLKFKNISTILCDELQDTSAPQLEMLKQLQIKLNCNMIGTSDDDQNIFSWRGARHENVQDFIDIFKCKVLNMGINFRSTKKIVSASNKLIENNTKRIPKIIRANKQDDGHISQRQFNNIFDEINYVVTKCRQFKDKKIAILYRNRTFKNHLEFELKKANIKYIVNDILELSDRSAIKVMLSSMKLAAMTADIYDLELASKGLRSIGKKTIEHLRSELSKENTLSDILRLKFENPKQKNRFNSLKNISTWFSLNKNSSLDKLASYIETQFIESFDYQLDMKNFILDITKEYKTNITDIRDLCNDLGLDGKEENNDKGALIELSTIHSYKGLQANTVIMPWCQQFETVLDKEYDLEAERRLFYVGVTRAESQLYLSYSGNKPKFIKELGI